MKSNCLVAALGVLVLQLGVADHASAHDELANLPDPTRPSRPAGAHGPGAAGGKLPQLRLESTVVSGHRRLAVINGKIFAVGDAIDGARIKLITPYLVMLEHHGRLVILKLVEANLTRPRGLQEAVR